MEPNKRFLNWRVTISRVFKLDLIAQSNSFGVESAALATLLASVGVEG